MMKHIITSEQLPVKHIATNHGGDVSLWSVEGAGSTFTIRFPLVVNNSPINQLYPEGN